MPATQMGTSRGMLGVDVYWGRAAWIGGGARLGRRDGRTGARLWLKMCSDASQPDPEPHTQSSPSWTELERTGMALALEEARRALDLDEVPIGAALLDAEGQLLGRGHNRTRTDCDPSAHAEVVAIRRAAEQAGVPRFPGAWLFTTVEPCFMCAGLLIHARVSRVVWGVRDPKFGGCASLGQVLEHPGANHRASWSEGLFATECRALLQDFFREKRAAARRNPTPE